MAEVFVGRQPIFDQKNKVFAYDLLYRNEEADEAIVLDDHGAARALLLHTLVDIGLEQVVAEHLAFIHVPRSFLLRGYCDLLPSDHVVVEVSSTIGLDEELRDVLGDLRAAGYKIALSDFASLAEAEPSIKIAEYIKIDASNTEDRNLKQQPELLAQQIAALKSQHKRVIAQKVDSIDDYEFSQELGFDYFQGFFFCQPSIVRGKELPANRVYILKLLTRLSDPDITQEQIAQLIEPDVTLSYRLLRFINSAAIGLPKKVTSIRSAAVYVGSARISTIARLIAMSTATDKSPELVMTSLQRATMCELMARAMKHPEPERFFTVGMFSVLDALMDMPMSEILKSIGLATELEDAILNHAGLLGAALRCVVEYERGNWAAATCGRLDAGSISNAYRQSVVFARKLANDVAS